MHSQIKSRNTVSNYKSCWYTWSSHSISRLDCLDWLRQERDVIGRFAGWFSAWKLVLLLRWSSFPFIFTHDLQLFQWQARNFSTFVVSPTLTGLSAISQCSWHTCNPAYPNSTQIKKQVRLSSLSWNRENWRACIHFGAWKSKERRFIGQLL